MKRKLIAEDYFLVKNVVNKPKDKILKSKFKVLIFSGLVHIILIIAIMFSVFSNTSKKVEDTIVTIERFEPMEDLELSFNNADENDVKLVKGHGSNLLVDENKKDSSHLFLPAENQALGSSLFDLSQENNSKFIKKYEWLEKYFLSLLGWRN